MAEILILKPFRLDLSNIDEAFRSTKFPCLPQPNFREDESWSIVISIQPGSCRYPISISKVNFLPIRCARALDVLHTANRYEICGINMFINWFPTLNQTKIPRLPSMKDTSKNSIYNETNLQISSDNDYASGKLNLCDKEWISYLFIWQLWPFWSQMKRQKVRRMIPS